MSALPAAVRRIRKDQGLTIQELAFRSGLSIATVQRIETGKHAPSLESLTAVAQALDTTPSALLAEPAEAAS